jgi:RNA polymerase sigma-70 factor, ECF subfamily
MEDTLAPLFDANWRQQAMRGDPAAVKQLTGAVLHPLYSFCLYRVGRNQHLCEEVVQETMLRAIRDLKNYEPARANNNIFPWLTGLARNEIQRLLNNEKNVDSLQALWLKMDQELLGIYARLEAEPLEEEVLRREETRELVNATMAQLPPQYRQALEGKYLNRRSVRDLAQASNLSEKAMESQLTRARNAFKETFTALARNLEAELV